MSDKKLHKALQDAFYVCFEISDAMGNIIAGSTDVDPAKNSDVILKKKADNYIKWYTDTFKK